MRPYLMVPVDQAVSKCGLENLDNIAGERTRVVHKTCGPAKVIVDIRWLPVQARFPLLSGQDHSLHRPRPRVRLDPAFTGSSHCASPNPLLSSLPQMFLSAKKWSPANCILLGTPLGVRSYLPITSRAYRPSCPT